MVGCDETHSPQSETHNHGPPTQPLNWDGENPRPRPTPRPNRPQPYSQRAASGSLTRYQEGILGALTKPADEDEQFLLSLLSAFKRLENLKRSEVRMGFQKLLHEAEFGPQ
ncbi:hypothetical protein EYF80_060476 [Liparis tanakae]|uniref:BESS domain-containing protein n=1 Tax=Liparis tanakae TaxID=230148 RepID=A0A4Z2EKI2_9TELE|nr:hypothetical protein EYF80_060476 [Liparis tanakae]